MSFPIRCLQLVSLPLSTQVRHSHDLDHQTRPASEMLCPLSLASLGIVLLPCEARLFPALVHSVNKIPSELGIQLGCACLVWSLLLSNFLVIELAVDPGCLERHAEDLQEVETLQDN
jgi:hypothetical protein